MSHIRIEILYESRQMSIEYNSMVETFALSFCLDENIDPFIGDTTYGPKFFENPPINSIPDQTAADDVIALEYAYSVFPPFRELPLSAEQQTERYQVARLSLKTIQLNQVGPKEWRAEGTYIRADDAGVGLFGFPDGKNALPYILMSFTIGGGTKRITQSIFAGGYPEIDVSSQFDFAVGDAPPELAEGVIGLTESKLGGLLVPNSELTLQITAYYKPSFVDVAFAVMIKDLMSGKGGAGSTNSQEFLGQDAEEVSLIGASGGTSTNNVVPITYEFSVRKNQTDITDGPFPPISVLKGQDIVEYLWFRKTDDNSGKVLARPAFRAIHKIKEQKNYDALEIPQDPFKKPDPNPAT